MATANTNPDTFRTIRNNLSYLLSTEMVIRGLLLALTVYLARKYSTKDFGIYTLALSVGGLFEIICNMGLATVFMQRVTNTPSKITAQLSIFLSLRLALSIVGFSLFVLFCLLLQKDTETLFTLVLAGLYFSIFALVTFLWACFDVHQKMHFTAAAKLLKYGIIFGLSVYYIFYTYPVHFILISYIIGVICSLIFTIITVRKHFTAVTFNLKYSEWKKIIAEGWPISLSGTFIFIYNYLDTIIISLTKGEEAVGLYQVSYKIVGTILLIAVIINQAFLPPLLQATEKGTKALSELFNKSLQQLFFWSLPITFGGFLLADQIIPFVFGDKYFASIPAFKILIWNCLIFFVSSAMINLSYALKKQKQATKIFFLGAIFNTIFNFFIIPRYGIQGAATTTLLAETIVLIGAYNLIKKDVTLHLFSTIIKPLLTGGIMTLGLLYIPQRNLFLTIFTGAAIYFSTYLIINRFKL